MIDNTNQPLPVAQSETALQSSAALNLVKAHRACREAFQRTGDSALLGVISEFKKLIVPFTDAMRSALNAGEFFVGQRDPQVNPESPGQFMVRDQLDLDEGYAIVGDDLDELICEAHDHLYGSVPASPKVVNRPATKPMRIKLSARTRVEYNEVIQVPADISQQELQTLLDMRYDQVDGGDYTDDQEYWERGDCEAVDVEDEDPAPMMAAYRTDKGLWIERASSKYQAAKAL